MTTFYVYVPRAQTYHSTVPPEGLIENNARFMSKSRQGALDGLDLPPRFFYALPVKLERVT